MRSPADVQAAFADGVRGGAMPGGLIVPGVRTQSPEDLARRFAVYRNNVAVGLVDALAARFPIVLRIVGDEFFRAMARLFVAASPPPSPVLLDYGGAFPAFVAGFGPARTLPYLADVARLEVACGEAWHAADASPASAAILAAATHVRPEFLRFGLHPSLRIVGSAHPIVSIWSMNRPGANPSPLADRAPEIACVMRPEGEVLVAAITPGRAALLRVLAAGGNLAAAVAAGLRRDPALDPVAELVALIGSGLVVDIVAPDAGARQGDRP